MQNFSCTFHQSPILVCLISAFIPRHLPRFPVFLLWFLAFPPHSPSFQLEFPSFSHSSHFHLFPHIPSPILCIPLIPNLISRIPSPIPLISTLITRIPLILTLFPRFPTPITCIPFYLTMISGVHTLFSPTPLIQFSDSPFRFSQIAKNIGD